MDQLQERIGAFDLKGATACNASVVTGDDPVCITTTDRQWAYAAVFPLRDDPANLLTGDGRMIIRVEVSVDAGYIGIAVAQPDLSAFISAEQRVETTGERRTIAVTIKAPRPGVWLVVRNTADDGTVSSVRIHSIKAYLTLATEEDLPGGNGLEVFDSTAALAINRARLQHLASLELPLEFKTVLDVGCGVGHLSGFFVERGGRVTGVDARPENLARLESLYPGRETHVADVERDSLSKLGQFDVVFCYGLLYHTENPVGALRNITSCCRELLLLETIVTDHPGPMVQLADESSALMNEAVAGFGCRPSPAFIALALAHMGFSFVYTTREQPDFPDFQFEWIHDSEWRRDGHPLRRVFVASRNPIDNPHLTPL
jgi:SAM-dependent methyltransferase